MDNFFKMLIQNTHVLLDINIFTRDDNISLTSVKFDVHDVYLDVDNNKLMLTQKNGSTLTLPIDEWHHIDEDGEDSWKVVYENIDIYIYVEEIN